MQRASFEKLCGIALLVVVATGCKTTTSPTGDGGDAASRDGGGLGIDLDALDARIRGAATSDPIASAEMLQSLAAVDLDRATRVACDVLAPQLAKRARDVLPVYLRPKAIDARLVLAERALLVLAERQAAGSAIGGACLGKAAGLLMELACEAEVRCKIGGPLSDASSSDQTEALCTGPELERVLSAERGQPYRRGEAPRAALHALAVVTAAGRVPESFIKAHARRRYRIVQPAMPDCNGKDGLRIGERCRCAPADIREYACRGWPETDPGSPYCSFVIDDARKEIRGAIGSEPP